VTLTFILMTFYWFTIVTIAVSCTLFELLDVK